VKKTVFRKYGYYTASVIRLFAGFRDPVLIFRTFLRPGFQSVREVRLRKSGVRFLVRGAMDIWIIKETWLDRFYERYGVPIGAEWTVIDVGAGVGDFAIFAATRHPTNVVYAFEPFPESFRLLQENLRRNGVENVYPFDQAIAAQTGRVYLDISSNEPLQFGTARPSDHHIEVTSLSLADALARTATRYCDLLKMDCEGAEYDILFQAPDAVFPRIARLVMEYHEGVTPYSHRDLVSFLQAQGFQVRTYPNPVHPHLGFLRAVRENIS